MNRLLVIAALLLPLTLSACGKKEVEAPAPAPLVAPTDGDDLKWREYLGKVVAQNQQGVTDRVFPYYLPANSDVLTPEDEAADKRTQYARQLENVNVAVQRTVLPGNMLAFGSPDSAKMADLIVAAFAGADPEALKGSQVLFIGTPADGDRVRPAVEAAGAKFVFVEVK